jgi:hypothetical protein
VYWLRIRKLLLSALVASTLLAVSVGQGGAVAASGDGLATPGSLSSHQQTAFDVSEKAALGYQATVRALDPYVVRSSDGTLSLNPTRQVARQVNSTYLAQLRAGLKILNRQIAAGTLRTTQDHRVYDAADTTLSIQGGWSGHLNYWWGVRYYLKELDTLHLEGALAMGASAATLGVIICGATGVGALVFGVIAAVLGFGVGWMVYVDNGNGIIVNAPYVGGIWLQGQ